MSFIIYAHCHNFAENISIMAIQNEIIKVVAQVELDDQGRAEAAAGLKKLNDQCISRHFWINTKTLILMSKLEKDIRKAADNIFEGAKWGLITGLILGLLMVIIFFSM